MQHPVIKLKFEFESIVNPLTIQLVAANTLNTPCSPVTRVIATIKICSLKLSKIMLVHGPMHTLFIFYDFYKTTEGIIITIW